jgi:hypothetical protein
MRNRWKLGIRPLASVIAAFVLACAVTGCASSEPQVTTAAPLTVVCGTELSDSAAGAIVFDATRQLSTIKYPTVGGVLIFLVARGCGQGTRVTWVPQSAAHLVKAAYARDGQMAAVVLRPDGPGAAFRLIGTRNGAVVAAATVKLAP